MGLPNILKGSDKLTELERFALDGYLVQENFLLAYCIAKGVSISDDLNQYKAASKWINTSRVKTYLQSRRAALATGTDRKTTQLDFTKKDDIVKELARLVPVTVGLERADILKQLADLQRMKNQEVTEEEKENTIHWYVTRKCTDECPLYRARQKKEQNQKRVIPASEAT